MTQNTTFRILNTTYNTYNAHNTDTSNNIYNASSTHNTLIAVTILPTYITTLHVVCSGGALRYPSWFTGIPLNN